MNYLSEYLIKYGKNSFTEKPINIIDFFILSVISYLPFQKVKTNNLMSMEDALFLCDKFKTLTKMKRKIMDIDMAYRFFSSKRFSKFNLAYPKEVDDNEKQKKFFAISFVCNNFVFVSIRGTDSTALGWKEDLNISFLSPIPSQIEASNYVCEMMKAYPKHDFYIGGHSKGGNCSIYAGSKNNSERLKKVFSFDGPGFLKEYYLSSEYCLLKNKIIKIVPEASIIGMMLNDVDNVRIIKSKSFNIMQHSYYNWIIDECDFIYKDRFRLGYEHLSNSINDWLNNESFENKKLFADSIYETFKALKIEEAKSAKENLETLINCRKYFVSYYANMDYERHLEFKRILRNLLETYIGLRRDSKNK